MDLWTLEQVLGAVLVISILSNGMGITVSAVSIQLERLRGNPPIVSLSDFSSAGKALGENVRLVFS